MDATDRWEMRWDDTSGSDDEPPSLDLLLPTGSLLVLRTRADTGLLRGRDLRLSCLAVESPSDYCVYDDRGHPRWRVSTSGGEVVMHDAAGRVIGRDDMLPRDHSAEATAAIDGAHLLDWLGPPSYTVDGDRIVGESEWYGPFTAQLNPRYRFVERVELDDPDETGGGPWRIRSWSSCSSGRSSRPAQGRPASPCRSTSTGGDERPSTYAPHIRSGASIPSRSSPVASTSRTAVHSASRDVRTSVSLFSTGHCS